MAPLTNFNDFGTEDMFAGDDFCTQANFQEQDWDLSSEEEGDFELEESPWEQTGREQSLDFDEMEELDEGLDDFHGAF